MEWLFMDGSWRRNEFYRIITGWNILDITRNDGIIQNGKWNNLDWFNVGRYRLQLHGAELYRVCNSNIAGRNQVDWKSDDVIV